MPEKKSGWFTHNGDKAKTVTLSYDGNQKLVDCPFALDSVLGDDFTVWVESQFQEHFNVGLGDIEFPPHFSPHPLGGF